MGDVVRTVNVVHRREVAIDERVADRVEPILAIETHMSPEERMLLLKTAMGLRSGFIACEIGSYLGASASLLALAASVLDGSVHCVDTWDNRAMSVEPERDTYEEFRRNTDPFARWITMHRGESIAVASQVPAPLDLLFIDGDHSYDGAKADLDHYAPKLRAGGLLLMHDFPRPEVERACADYLAGR